MEDSLLQEGPSTGAVEECEGSSPEKKQQRLVMTDHSPHSPSLFCSGVKEVQKIGSEVEPRKKEGVRGSNFEVWICFSLSYCDLIGNKLN